MSNNPQFLIQQSLALSEKEAEKIVDNYLKLHNIKFQSKGKSRQVITKKLKDGEDKTIKYFELINQVRKTGVCGFLSQLIDYNDNVFGRVIGGLGTTNYGMKLTFKWAGYEKEINGPGRATLSEIDLANDIEFYKEKTCFDSAEIDFDMCFRNYRAYLLSTTSLIDCYINRHIHLYNHIGRTSERFHKLKESRNIEEKIELFINEFCNFTFESFKESHAWSDFKKLKYLRNNVTHSLSPYLGAEIKEIGKDLNLSINGVGTFLKKLQEGQGRYTLSFIEKIRNSPIVHFNEIAFKTEGPSIVKKHFNKVIRY